MNARQKKFADEYLKTGNMYQSALKAGYSETYAKARSAELLDNIGIKQYVEERQAQIDNQNIADAQEIQEFLTSVLRGEEVETVATAKGLYEGVKLGGKDRIKAAELLGKTKAMFTDKKQVDASLNIDVGVGDDFDDD